MSEGTYEAHDGRELAKRIANNGNGTAPRILPASEMSASQRNQTLDATIQQLNLVITQVNALTQAQRETHPPGSEVGLIVYDIQRDSFNFYGSHADIAIRNAHQRIVGRTFWQRMLWIVVGR